MEEKEEEQTQEEIDFLKNWNKNTREWEIEKDGDNCILGKPSSWFLE